MLSLPIILLAVAVYVGAGLVLGRVASHKAYAFSGGYSSDKEFNAILWLWLTLFLWPAVLAGAGVFYLCTGLVKVVHRIALTEEAR